MPRFIVLFFLWIVPFFCQAQYHHIGDPNKTPDLAIPYCDVNWQFRTPCLGVASQQPITSIRIADVAFAEKYPPIQAGDTCLVISYICPITNIAQQDCVFPFGRNDFASSISGDGIYNPVTKRYGFPGFIDVGIYQVPNISLISKYIKTEYDVDNTDYKVGFNDNCVHYYSGDTMSIGAGNGDSYGNRVVIKMNSGRIPRGFYCLRVYINPLKLITESNYENNITLLPLVVKDSSAFINDSALLFTKPLPVTNLEGYVFWGNKKYVDINWEGNGENYLIYKSGILIATTKEKTYRDNNLKPGFKQETYSVQSEIKGFGLSETKSIIIKR